MSQDPYPGERPDPYHADPYSSDPYAPGSRPDRYAAPIQPPQGPTPPAGYPGAPVPSPYAYPPPQPPNTSAIVLTVVSGFLTLSGLCCYVTIVPLVFGIIGLAKQSSDPEGAEQMTKYGWISFALVMVVAVLLWVGFVALIVASES